MTIQTYRDLEVWQEAMSLTTEVYHLTRSYPREETYGLTSQTQRAAVSVPANIAEGHSRKSRKEFHHHVSIARGSLAELETHLLLAHRLEYLTRQEMEKVWEMAQRVGRLVNGLLRSLKETDRPPIPDA
ncbi:MAG: four helix bundle protein [Thermodesulfobacteriota bacterium]